MVYFLLPYQLRESIWGIVVGPSGVLRSVPVDYLLGLLAKELAAALPRGLNRIARGVLRYWGSGGLVHAARVQQNPQITKTGVIRRSRPSFLSSQSSAQVATVPTRTMIDTQRSMDPDEGMFCDSYIFLRTVIFQTVGMIRCGWLSWGMRMSIG